MGMHPSLLFPGVAVILGNDLAGERHTSSNSGILQTCGGKRLGDHEQNYPEVFQACAVAQISKEKMAGEATVASGDVVLLPAFPLSPTVIW